MLYEVITQNYFAELAARKIPLYLVSVIFRPEQLFFTSKPQGQWYRNILKGVAHFFVQNQQSADLLQRIGFPNYTITGDTVITSYSIHYTKLYEKENNA